MIRLRHDVVPAGLILVVIGLSMAGEIAQACRCRTPSVHEAFASSDAVFAGTVVAVRHSPPESTWTERGEEHVMFWSMALVRWTFRVGQWWKGEGEDSVEVYSYASRPSCGFVFEVGGDYVVYANRTSGLEERVKPGADGLRPLPEVLSTGSCSRTCLLQEAFADVFLLPTPVRVNPRWSCLFPSVTIDGLVDTIRNGSKIESRKTAAALVDIAPEGLMAVLQDMLGSSDPDARAVASWAMLRLGSAAAPAEEDLRKALSDEDEEVRANAQMTLDLIVRSRTPSQSP